MRHDVSAHSPRSQPCAYTPSCDILLRSSTSTLLCFPAQDTNRHGQIYPSTVFRILETGRVELMFPGMAKGTKMDPLNFRKSAWDETEHEIKSSPFPEWIHNFEDGGRVVVKSEWSEISPNLLRCADRLCVAQVSNVRRAAAGPFAAHFDAAWPGEHVLYEPAAHPSGVSLAIRARLDSPLVC